MTTILARRYSIHGNRNTGILYFNTGHYQSGNDTGRWQMCFFGVCIVCRKTISSLHINASLTSSISGGETFDKLPGWKLLATPFDNDIMGPLN